MTATTILELNIELQLRGPLAEKLIAECGERGRRPIDVLADIIEIVIGDNLFAAVLDK